MTEVNVNASVSNQTLLLFEIISAAADGDTDAINKVLKHFQAYIMVLSTRYLFDELGNRYEYVDEEKKNVLEIQLIAKILRFNPYEIV